MKKYYNVPATEVVAFVGGMLMESASPGADPLNPNGSNPGPGATVIP